MSQAYFIAGTDTDVGKTTIAAGLLHAARSQGLSTLGAKPVASGCTMTPKGLRNSDAQALIDESTIKLPYEQVNPFAFEPAIAPHVAAREAGVTLAVPDWLRQASNGTTGYLPPFLALAFFGTLVAADGNRAGWYNLAGSAIFVVSVICRMIDPMVCASFPLGTHFLWHILNGLMLGVLLAAAARYGAPKAGSRQ